MRGWSGRCAADCCLLRFLVGSEAVAWRGWRLGAWAGVEQLSRGGRRVLAWSGSGVLGGVRAELAWSWEQGGVDLHRRYVGGEVVLDRGGGGAAGRGKAEERRPGAGGSGARGVERGASWGPAIEVRSVEVSSDAVWMGRL
jgi:hypothetical protein